MASGKDCLPQKEVELLDCVEDFTAQTADNSGVKGLSPADAMDVQQKKAHFLICTGSARTRTGRGRCWSRKKTPQKTR
ncbi:MAG: hypothetical protein LBF60_00340 [Treponema sp.]|jgi:hypothetical protein|nr:hypothetical protein [Treponema sp.]